MPRDVNGIARKTKEDEERERRWKADEDFRTLSRAAEIYADKDRKAALLEMHADHADMLRKMFGDDGMGKKGEKGRESDK